MKVVAEFFNTFQGFENDPGAPDHKYELNHNDANHRRTLGMRCQDAFEEGMVVVTYRKPKE